MSNTTLLTRTSAERTATWCFGIWLLIVLLIDLLSLRVFPVPWGDEVMFADPAINMIQNGQWASTAWYGRGDMTFWAGNSPLYCWLLYPWLRFWGPEMESVRSFNCVLAAIAFAFGWFAAQRVVQSPWIRLAVMMALTMCYPISFNVRCGRPDVVGLLLLALGALAWTRKNRRIAIIGLALIGVILPFSGLHYAGFIPILLGVLWWQTGREGISRLAAIVAGGLLGGLLFCAYHQFFVGWDGLISSMSDVRSRFGSRWAQVVNLPESLFLRYYLIRPHFLLLFLVLGLFWLHSLLRPARAFRRALWLATIFLVVPGIVLTLLVHFGVPYHPLAIVPGALLLAHCAELTYAEFNSAYRWILAAALTGIGVSGRLVFLGLGLIADNRSYLRTIEAEAREAVHPSDIVYGHWQLYYALKPATKTIYFNFIVPRLNDAEKQAVTAAFLPEREGDATWLSETFGGTWRRTQILSAPNPIPGPRGLLAGFNSVHFFGQQLTMYRRETSEMQRSSAP